MSRFAWVNAFISEIKLRLQKEITNPVHFKIGDLFRNLFSKKQREPEINHLSSLNPLEAKKEASEALKEQVIENAAMHLAQEHPIAHREELKIEIAALLDEILEKNVDGEGFVSEESFVGERSIEDSLLKNQLLDYLNHHAQGLELAKESQAIKDSLDAL